MIAPTGAHGEIAGPALRYRQLAGELRRSGVEATLAIPGPGGDADWSMTRPSELAVSYAIGTQGPSTGSVDDYWPRLVWVESP